jgi:predicted N-acetyltransferase YhbS
MDDDYEARIRAREAFIAVAGGEIVGLIVLARRPGHLLIENVAVEPAHQEAGIGRALMEYAERHSPRTEAR